MAYTLGFVTAYKGNDEQLVFTVVNAAGTVVNITNASAFEFILSTNEYATALVTKTKGSGVSITNGEAGQFTVSLSTTDTASLSGRYFFRVNMTLSSVVETVAMGVIWFRET